jgi:hypothetical protein
MKFNSNTVGLYSGALISFCHLVWVIMVALGLAQGWLNFIFGLHFVNNPFQVRVFNLSTAVTLVIMTFVVGYMVGWVSTWAWNKMKK